MKRGERIPLHDHSDGDSGGLIHAPSVVTMVGMTPESGGGGPSDSSAFELRNEGGQSTIFAHGSTGSTETIDPTDGTVHTLTLNANCTITLNAPAGSGAALLELWVTEDSTGGWAITWPGSVTEQGSHDTTLSTTQRVLLDTVNGGTSWIASWIGTGGSSLTVKDEGGALATAATSIDFVGGGVTASGTGAAKTVTIPGGATSSDTGIWRPLMDSGSGAVITDGATGEAVMGFGPA